LNDAPRILLVDDERFTHELYGSLLTRSGYQVESAQTAKEALKKSSRERFDLVITDLLLPDSDGVALLAELKRRDPELGVIVITALEEVGPAVRAMRGGASDYLTKPISPDALELSVSRCLETQKLVRENQELRKQLGLFETGQRITATLETSSLWPLALQSLIAEAGAQSGMLVAIDDDELPRPLHRHGLEETQAKELADRLHPEWSRAASGPVVLGLDSPKLAWRRGPIALVPCHHGRRLQGVAVLCFSDAQPDPARLTRCEYLGRYVGLAQSNASRYAEAEDLAYTDDLTGLRNARFLRVTLDRLISREDQPFTLLFADIDRFKLINDQFGHLQGSRLLVETGRVVRGCVRDIDVVARYGGDEYTIALVDTDSGGGLKVAERVRRAMEEHRFQARENMEISVTLCIGVASYPEHGRERDALIQLADAAMYRGKRGARNVVYLATPAATR
jgi:two-component system cell cycle response regulator